jgi:hypothetical protein
MSVGELCKTSTGPTTKVQVYNIDEYKIQHKYISDGPYNMSGSFWDCTMAKITSCKASKYIYNIIL